MKKPMPGLIITTIQELSFLNIEIFYPSQNVKEYLPTKMVSDLQNKFLPLPHLTVLLSPNSGEVCKVQ